MTRSVLILGGYGNFGKRIGRALARNGVPFILAGRDDAKAVALAVAIRAEFPGASAEGVDLDADGELVAFLREKRPSVVINTVGPFQKKDYRVAKQCIAAGVHYVDLADGRDFVAGFGALDAAAKAAKVCAITGASSVPALSAAVLDHYRREFASYESLEYGISPGQKTERGLATTAAILSYVGKALKPTYGARETVYCWRDVKTQLYPHFGRRWLAACDIPDLDVLPPQYGLQHIRFYAGVESATMFWSTWVLALLIRAGVPLDLPRYAPQLWRAAKMLDRFGSDVGGMHVIMKGIGQDGAPHQRRWFLVAEQGHGPEVPTGAAINLARRIHAGERFEAGARPCMGFVSLDQYLGELKPFAIYTIEA